MSGLSVIDLIAANHTNRELELMRAGKKPLAMFYAESSELPREDLIPEQKFAPYVTNNQFVRYEMSFPGSFNRKLGREMQIKYVLFALKEEVWRINAMLLLKKQHYKTGTWNETCERVESELLGYSEEEIDAWCIKSFPKTC